MKKKNEPDYHITKYDEVVNALKGEIDYLKAQLEVKNQNFQINSIIFLT